MIGVIRQAVNLAIAGLLMLVAIGDREVVQALLAYASPAPEPSIEATDSGSLTLRADARGHYLVTAEVDGKPVRFLVDTGASGVVLSRRDAERLNLRSDQLVFTRSTAPPEDWCVPRRSR